MSVAHQLSLLPDKRWTGLPNLDVELGKLHAAVNEWLQFAINARPDLPLDDFLSEIQEARRNFDVEKLIELELPDELVAQTRLVSALLSLPENIAESEHEDAGDEQRESSRRG